MFSQHVLLIFANQIFYLPAYLINYSQAMRPNRKRIAFYHLPSSDICSCVAGLLQEYGVNQKNESYKAINYDQILEDVDNREDGTIWSLKSNQSQIDFQLILFSENKIYSNEDDLLFLYFQVPSTSRYTKLFLDNENYDQTIRTLIKKNQEKILILIDKNETYSNKEEIQNYIQRIGVKISNLGNKKTFQIIEVNSKKRENIILEKGSNSLMKIILLGITEKKNQIFNINNIIESQNMKEMKDSLKKIVSKYGVEKIQIALNDLLEGHIDDVKALIKTSRRDSFLEQVQGCKDYSLWIQKIKFKESNKQIKNIFMETKEQSLKKIAEIAAKTILEQFSLTSHQQSISAIFNNDLSSLKTDLARDQRPQFEKAIKDCTDLQNYLSVKKEDLCEIDQENKLQLAAEISLKKILDKYNASSKKQTLKRIFNSNIQEAKLSVEVKQRRAFQESINNCYSFQNYNSFRQKKKINLKNLAIQAIHKILETENIKSIQNTTATILKGDFKTAADEVRLQKRQKLISQLEKCGQLMEFRKLQNHFPNSPKDEIKKTLQFYQIEDSQECLNYIFQNNQVNLNNFIQQCDKNYDQDKEKRIKAENAVKKILNKYKPMNMDETLNFIFQENMMEAEKSIKRDQRQIFQKQIGECQQLRLFKLSKPIDKNLKILENAKAAVEYILIDLQVAQFQYALTAIFNGDLASALAEIHQKNIETFHQRLRQSQQYQTYLRNQQQLNNHHQALSLLNHQNSLEIFQKVTNFLSLIILNSKIYKKDQQLEKYDLFKKFIAITQPERLLIIQKQIEIQNNQKNQEYRALKLQILQEIKNIIIFKHYSLVLKARDDLLIIKQKSIEEIRIENSVKEKNLESTTHKYVKEELYSQINSNKSVLDFDNQVKLYQTKLVFKSFSQYAVYFNEYLASKNIAWENLSDQISSIANQIKINIKKYDVATYVQLKKKLIRLEFIHLFETNNVNAIKELKSKIKFNGQEINLILNFKNLMGKDLYKIIQNKLKINAEDVMLIGFSENKSWLIFNEENVIEERMKLVDCFATIKVSFAYRQKIFQLKYFKQIEPQHLRTIICKKLQQESILVGEQTLLIYGLFGEKDFHEIRINEKIQNLQIKNKGQLRSLKVKLLMKVNVFYESNIANFQMESDKTIEDVKAKIFESLKIPINSFSILFARGQVEEELYNSKILDSLEAQNEMIDLIMIGKMNLKHYGFHQNYQLKYEDFRQFFVQSQEEIEMLIKSCTLKKEEEEAFFKQLINFLFAAAKKHFSFQSVTNDIKQKIYKKKSQAIWQAGLTENFTNNFILYYLLYNSDLKLRVQLMNITKYSQPLPLYFREFKNINEVKHEWNLNESLLWLLHPACNIVSIGLHNTEHSKSEKGKSFLNNLLFYTKFQNHANKHPISEGCPEISLKILENIFPFNFIDVPGNTNKKILHQILKISHILIIHSWLKQKQTKEYLKKLKQNYNIENTIVFMRDSKNKQTDLILKDIKFDQHSHLEIPNIQEYSDKNIPVFTNLLRDKVWEYIDNVFKNKIQSESLQKIYQLYNNDLFKEFENKLERIKPIFMDLKTIVNQYEQIKEKINQKDNRESVEEATHLKRVAIKNGLKQEVKDIFIAIKQAAGISQLFMLRFREVIKEYKNITERKYFVINIYMKMLDDRKISQKELKSFLLNAEKQINSLPNMKKISLTVAPHNATFELKKAIQYVENKIKPNLFSIQLAWRELQYLTTLDEEAKLGESNLLNFLVDIKRKQIYNSQPFELLDGDFLEMAKTIMKKVFESIPDRTAVLTILGPQSSGKSTLLNFLFGCDFGISQGRCTRGVYGTYFKFSNLKFTNCQGVFLIDTEGLFAVLNAHDEKSRKDFDSKLVLFCLAVSDFVIINTKGNLDNESVKIIKSAIERFKALTEENLEMPEIFLVLNQCASGSNQTSEGDINKLSEIFPNKNAKTFTQAYDRKHIKKQQISMIPLHESIVKSTPQPQFLVLCMQLLDSLIERIKIKQNFKPIRAVIDLMERVWNTIEAFPNLGLNISQNIQEKETSIKQWRLIQLQKFSNQGKQLFQKFKTSNISQKSCLDDFEDLKKNILEMFRQDFSIQDDRLKQEEVTKISLEEKKLELALEAIKYEMRSQIKDLEISQLVAKSKSEGNDDIKEAIRKTNKKQKSESLELSKEQREAIFNQAYTLTLERTQKTINPETQILNSFDRIYEYYSNASNTAFQSKNKNDKAAGLLKAQWKCEVNHSYREFSLSNIQKIHRSLGDDCNSYVEYRKNPPTKTLDESSKTDAKLNYFNMRKYFHKKKIQIRNLIDQKSFELAFKIDLLKAERQNLLEADRDSNQIDKVFKIINNFFRISGFIIQNKQSFLHYLQYKAHWYNWIDGKWNFQIKVEKKKENHNSSNRKNYEPNFGKMGSSNINEDIELKSQDDQINENEFLLLKQFLNIPKLHKLLQQQYANVHNFQKYIENNLKNYIIEWKKIQQYIEKSKTFEHKKQNISNILLKKVNKELLIFGLEIQMDNFYDYLKERQENSPNQQYKVRFLKKKWKCLIYEKQNDCLKVLNGLTYFNSKTILTKLRKFQNSSPSQNLELGRYYEERFEVLPEYSNNRNLKIYISDETNSIFSSLQSDSMRKFLFSELKEKETFQKLFHNIDEIIKKSPPFLNLNTVTGIFIDVNEEIIRFNDDLNQVSHKLTLLFTGNVHLYSVYMIWKKFSDALLQEVKKPYTDLINDKEKQLNFFLNETDANDNKKSEGEADRFMNQFIEFMKILIKEHKMIIIKDRAKQYNMNNTRSIIQSKVDHESFSRSSKQQDWIKYLTKPNEVIQQKYNSLTLYQLERLKELFQNCPLANHIMSEFRQTIKIVLQKLKAENIGEQSIHTDIFSISAKSVKEISIMDNQILVAVNQRMMDLFLNVLGKSQVHVYKEPLFDLVLKKKGLKIAKEPVPLFQKLVTNIREKKLSITNLYTFVEMVGQRLNKKENMEKITLQIKDLLDLKKEDEIEFRSLTAVKVCQQLCPGCQRICGVSQAHTTNHECKYGHQMRALGGVSLINGEASVVRCEDVEAFSPIKYNNKLMTWKQFKEYWENKQTGAWRFNDLKKSTNKELFMLAWDIAGEQICRRHQMKFVKSNQVTLQKATSTTPTHFIFVLDDSGSMSGKRWTDLMEAFQIAITKIRSLPNAEVMIKISILIEGSTCQIFQSNVIPNAVNFSIKPRYGGNNFADTFQKAIPIMKSYVSTSKIKFIFMTDGGCGYPTSQVSQVKALQSSNPGKIQYSGIEFQSNTETMKLMQSELGGTNVISYNLMQLTSAYLQIINRKQ